MGADQPICPTVLVAAIAEAEGSRGAAAALACAAAAEKTALLVDLGAPKPRPTLLASRAAQALERQLTEGVPGCQVAARGEVCHLAVSADSDGLRIAGAAVTSAGDTPVVVHLPRQLLPLAVDGDLLRPTAALLRADMPHHRHLASKTVRDLLRAELAVSILGRRLNWVSERRALFGALVPDAPGGLPAEVRRRLLPTRAD